MFFSYQLIPDGQQIGLDGERGDDPAYVNHGTPSPSDQESLLSSSANLLANRLHCFSDPSTFPTAVGP